MIPKKGFEEAGFATIGKEIIPNDIHVFMLFEDQWWKHGRSNQNNHGEWIHPLPMFPILYLFVVFPLSPALRSLNHEFLRNQLVQMLVTHLAWAQAGFLRNLSCFLGPEAEGCVDQGVAGTHLVSPLVQLGILISLVPVSGRRPLFLFFGLLGYLLLLVLRRLGCRRLSIALAV